MHQDAMNVAFPRIGIDLQIDEALSEIVRHKQRTDFDADREQVAVEHDVLDVTDPRRRRKRPFRHGLGVAQRLQLAPRLTLVLADVEMRGQRAGKHRIAALQSCRRGTTRVMPVLAQR